MRNVSLFLVVLLFAASPAWGGNAISVSGDYLAYCQESIKIYGGKSADKSASSSCLGFVEGSIGMHAVFDTSGQGTPFYCVSESGISISGAIAIWVDFLENNPEKLGNSPAITFILAMREAYPCP